MTIYDIFHYLSENKLIKAAAVLVLAVIINLVFRLAIDAFVKRVENHSPENAPKMNTLFSIMRTSVMILIYFTAAVFVFQILFDTDAATIVTATGVVGVVIGFGAQSIVKDSISGFFILLENQYAVDDLVTVGDFTGYVESVTIRTTVIRNFEGDRLIIPNGNMTQVINHNRDDKRILINVHIAYDESIDKAFAVIRTALEKASREVEGVVGVPELLGVTELGPVAVKILILTHCETGTQYEVERAILKYIKDAFDENKIKMPLTEKNR